MFLFLALATTVGLVNAETTIASGGFPEESLEWDCSSDHAPHGSDPRKFLQSANGFGEQSNVAEARCSTAFQEFAIFGRLCRCRYVEPLRKILSSSCQIRTDNSITSDQYELLVPNLDADSIDGLFKTQSCFNVLPGYIADAYQRAGVIPLFFNTTGCRCDWVEGVDRSIENGLEPPVGGTCERLIDQNFTSTAISSDEVGNFVQVFPYSFQNNATLARGGTAFTQGISEVIWRLANIDFVDITFVFRFEADGGGNQGIATNFCRERYDTEGLFDLQFDPSSRSYSLQFFGERVERCTVPSTSGVQNVQLRYSAGEGVSLIVNNNNCDVSALNSQLPATEDGRLALNSRCPLSIGGRVYTDPTQADFGTPTNDIANLEGVFHRVMLLRNCALPPQALQDKVDGRV